MKSNVPWSVKGIDPEARVVAKEAARKAGMTLGEWMSSMIQEVGADTPTENASAAESAPVKAAVSEDQLRAVIDSLNRLNERLQTTEARVEKTEEKSREAVGSINQGFETVFERIKRLEREKAEGKSSEGTTPAAPATPTVDPALAAEQRQKINSLKSLETALGSMLDQFEQMRKDALTRVEANESAVERLEKRVDKLDAKLAAGFQEVHDALDTVSGQLDHTELTAKAVMLEAREAAGSNDAEFVERTGRKLHLLGNELKRSGDQISAVEQMVASLSAKIESAEQRSAEGIAEVAAELDALRQDFLETAINDDDEEAGWSAAAREAERTVDTLQKSYNDMVARLEGRLALDGGAQDSGTGRPGKGQAAPAAAAALGVAGAAAMAATAARPQPNAPEGEEIGPDNAIDEDELEALLTEQEDDALAGSFDPEAAQDDIEDEALAALSEDEALANIGEDDEVETHEAEIVRDEDFLEDELDDDLEDEGDEFDAVFETDYDGDELGDSDIEDDLFADGPDDRPTPASEKIMAAAAAREARLRREAAPEVADDFDDGGEFRDEYDDGIEEELEHTAHIPPHQGQPRTASRGRNDGHNKLLAFALMGGAGLLLLAIVGGVLMFIMSNDQRGPSVIDPNRPGQVDTAAANNSFDNGPIAPARGSVADGAALYGQALQELRTAQTAEQEARGFERMREAAVYGYIPAQAQLGELYFNGTGTQLNLPEAKRWFTSAAEGGNRHAMYRLGTIATDPAIDGRDYNAAIGWFERAASYGHVDSTFNLGYLYDPASDLLPPNQRDAAQSYYWYSLAARQGDPIAPGDAANVATQLTDAQIAAIDARVANWTPVPLDPAANDLGQ